MKNLLLSIFCLTSSLSFTQAEESLEFQSNDIEVSIANFLLSAEALQSSNDADSALSLLENAEILAEGLEDLTLLNNIKFRIGITLAQASRFEESINYFNQSVELSSITKDTAQIAETYRKLGISYKHLGVYPKAIQAYNQANLYYASIHDTIGQGSTKINIGNIYKSIGQNRRAKQKYREAIQIFSPMGNLNSLGDCYNNLGNVYKNENNYDSSAYYMFKTLEIRREAKDAEKLSFIYHNLANLHIKMEDYQTAELYVDSAYKLKFDRSDYYGTATELEVYSRIHYFKEEWKPAIEKGELALEIARPYHVLEFDKEVLRILGFSCFKNGDFEKSASYYSRFMDADETLRDLNQSNQIEFELMSFEMLSDSIQREQLILQKELKDAENRNEELANSVAKRNYVLIIGGLVILIFIIAFIYIQNRRRLYQSRSETAKLEKSSVPKEEKEILLKEVHHRVKNNFQIINSLIRIQSEYINPSNYSEKLKELENRIQSMSLIHEKLYKSDSLSRLNVKEYVAELSANLITSLDFKENIEFKFEIDDAEYGIDSLIPLGLILNESISNSIKHAFEGKESGTIFVRLKNSETETNLMISDDGIGADLSIDELKEESLGMELLYDLTDQLDGELKLDTTKGFKYQFNFPRLK
ncbi:MAG: two-component sensor histidine kinase/Flp pilus assembly protein TadD [Arenicella sp.]|jgi:two-component sensor histidine kinase/Flp pilus assembly protein TadD